MRIPGLAVVLFLVGAACSPSGAPVVTTSAAVGSADDVSASTTSTVLAQTSSSTATTTTLPAPDGAPDDVAVFTYVVVAEKQSRRLAIIDPEGPCLSSEEPCELSTVATIGLPLRPHNIASLGSVVYATHPDAGSISRVDVPTKEVLTASVGTEPHDVKYDAQSGLLAVADEEGRRILSVDPETLEVVGTVELPAKPHDLTVDRGVLWVTMIGTGELARITGGTVDFVETGGLPHDLLVDGNGSVWFSNWGSDRLSIFDPVAGFAPDARAGVGEPQHFAIAPNGVVWISDIAGDAVVGFSAEGSTTVLVGESPHHVAFAGEILVVAVSGTGEAVFVKDGVVVARSTLTPGLHGVAIVELAEQLAS